MLSSALVGALVSGSALAQTTITGELRLSYKATGSSVASGSTNASQRGFGSEQQINVQTKGKLNVGGLEYAAGFAMENDGEQATTCSMKILTWTLLIQVLKQLYLFLVITFLEVIHRNQMVLYLDLIQTT